MKKMKLLAFLLPMCAMAVTSCNGAQKISVDEAIEFAVKNHDPHQYDGYNVEYGLDLNGTKLTNGKVIRKRYISPYTEDFVPEVAYLIDGDLSGIKGTLVNNIPFCLNSSTILQVSEYLDYTKALTDYLEAGFTKSGNHLGIYLNTKKDLAPLLNIPGALFGTIIKMIIPDPSALEGLGAIASVLLSIASFSFESVTLNLDVQLTRFGFLSSADIDLSTKGGYVTLTGVGEEELAGSFIEFSELNLRANLKATYSI